MKNKIIILIILVIALIAIVLATKGKMVTAPVEDNSPTQEIIPLAIPDLIRVSNIKEGDTISSPVTITGEARGNWYFEATFPITITNADGNIIGEGIATAQSDWMTSNFVPFTAKIQFKNATSTTSKKATLILHKDNPSGLPQFDAALEIPVVLK